MTNKKSQSIYSWCPKIIRNYFFSEDLRVAEVVKLDLSIDESKVTAYRTRLAVSFKYHGDK